jgi:hypothetical protein
MTDNIYPNAEDIETSQAARDEAESGVLHPETMTRTFKFMSKEVKLRALPIFYARKVNKCLEPFKSQFAESVGKQPDELAAANFNLDESATNALIECCLILADFYKLDLGDNPKETLEREATLNDISKLCEAQLEVQGKADFLLTPLRVITRLTTLVESASDEMDKQVKSLNANSSPTPLSANPGELASTN